MKKTAELLAATLAALLILAGCSLFGAPPAEDDSITGGAPDELVTILNNDVPYFTQEDYDYAARTGYFIELSELDALGRVGTAWGLLDYSHMPPSGSRDFTLDTEPTGWVQNRYSTDLVEAGWLYNRSHLIGYQLSGIEDEPKDLMTGTRLFNTPGMLQYEDMTASHLRDQKSHHVLYRVTPDFEGDNLLAYGVTMESDCIECDGADYCVYIANIQPGITIDYATGRNWEGEGDVDVEDPSTLPDAEQFVLNTSSGKFHLPDCRYAQDINPANRQEITAPRSWMMAHGYEPCGVCNP